MDVIVNQIFKPNSLIYKSWINILIFSLLYLVFYKINHIAYFLVLICIFTFPITLLTATTLSPKIYFRVLALNAFFIFLINMVAVGYSLNKLFYCLVLYFFIDILIFFNHLNNLILNPNFKNMIPPKLNNRDQFSLDFEVMFGRVWQAKGTGKALRIMLMMSTCFTILISYLNDPNAIDKISWFYTISGAFFSFFIWEYTIKRFLFFAKLLQSG
ncbi:hypothetical protein ACINWC323_3255 [Acinetobacter sp. WC-323]|uniref:hypothetical protein n=1 Tax=Acinetobacter sp. WC-323 TaxID=903918 RepID=UPI00029DFA48|nr:hypothetical protein [Acinetobacter sp. WC-323]EKU54466.1 hypothetical protein ACINWC323_3255 [Acinetobacter sp. WC-323]